MAVATHVDVVQDIGSADELDRTQYHRPKLTGCASYIRRSAVRDARRWPWAFV